ncbi:MAG: Trk system potassium transporter TrkA [Polyangiaceae bacterium]
MRVVVLGAGEVGTHVGRELSQGDNEVILVDKSAQALSTAEESLDCLSLAGDATHWSVLEAAEVARADLVVAVTGSDEVNVVAAALATKHGARRSVARVDAPSFYRTRGGVEAGVLGIHALLCASRLVSEELRRLVEQLDAKYVSNFTGNAVQAALLPVTDDSPLLGKPALEIKPAKGVSVVGVVRDAAFRSPVDIVRLELDDSVMVSGPPGAVAGAIQSLRVRREQRRAVVVGGGDVGFQLCQMLRSSAERVQVIERDRARCEVLSETLQHVEVIHGDGTHISCLRDEHVESADYLAAVTRADEVNLMASLVAHDIGVPRAFALVHRPGYADVYAHLGIHGTAGPHDVIAKTVRWLLPHRGALSTEALPGTGHHLFEYQLGEHAGKGITLAELALPAETQLVGVARQLECVPLSASLRLQSGDNIVVAAPVTAAREIEKRVVRAGGKR